MAFNSNNNTPAPQTATQSTPTQGNGEDENGLQLKKKNLIILVEKDSNDKLNELFDKTLSNKLPLQVPYHMRKLPASFFKPPSSGSKSPSVSVSHSRENSADSAFGSGTTILGGVNGISPNSNNAPSALPNGLAIHHSRAHSSPASLGKIPVNLSALNAANTSANIAQSPLSPNSKNATHKSGSGNGTNSNINNNLPHNIQNKLTQHIHSRGRSYDIPSLQQQIQYGELPGGWEQAKTQDGKIYYINHNTRTTQWEDPRIQAAAAALSQNSLFSEQSSVETLFSSQTLNSLGSSQNVAEPLDIHNNTQSQPLAPLSAPLTLPPALASVNNSNLGPLPEGWEEGITEDGNRFYINHAIRSTSWRDPRLSNQDWAAQEQTVRLYNLQMERERLRRRQQEIKSHIGEDPFLTGITDHTRQESGDSGLSVSMSHTPDFLSSIDDSMDGLSVTDNTMDTITFNDAMETPDEFMLHFS